MELSAYPTGGAPTRSELSAYPLGTGAHPQGN